MLKQEAIRAAHEKNQTKLQNGLIILLHLKQGNPKNESCHPPRKVEWI